MAPFPLYHKISILKKILIFGGIKKMVILFLQNNFKTYFDIFHDYEPKFLKFL